ncbi:MAG: DUF1287 domain-containing protein [Lachnospiraceae bacterium]|nr:DUF1287 domain-containing protein [Lachnospiraceae bacterium]
MRRKREFPLVMAGLTAVALVFLLVCLLIGKLLDGRRYYDQDFGFEPYISSTDANGDGIDDQTEILEQAKKYVASKPSYRSEYYETGYPVGDCGVCTDVVGYAMLHSGYDLMKLVHEDVLAVPEAYPKAADERIDFRRVVNLEVWFKRHAAYDLTTDIYQIDQWEGGDIVLFPGHIGVVSDRRNRKGIPYIIHHGRPGQQEYEEDILEGRDDVTGHYRMS